MQFSQRVPFSLRLLKREWKAGELTVLAIALIVAIASHTTINHFTDRISRAMIFNANNLIGGDLVLSNSREIEPDVKDKAQSLNLDVAEVQRFVTVVNAEDNIQLVSVKSVSENYPLKGVIKVTDELFGPEQIMKTGPRRGEVWVEARVLQTLNIEIGDQVAIGESNFIVSKVLTYEPDRGNNFYSINARAMINGLDLAKTNIVQPGSRVSYRQMYTGSEDNISTMRQWLQENLQPGQRIKTLEEDQPAVSGALDKAQQYMGLTSLIALLLATIAIANSGRHYSERHYDTSALLRCLGCKQNDILSIFLIQLVMIAVIGGVVGNVIGWVLQAILFSAVGHLLPDNIPGFGFMPVLSGMVLSLVILIGFTLPSILRLKSVPPAKVLRNDLSPLPLSAKLVYLFSAGLIALLMWVYTQSLTLTLSVFMGSGLVIVVAMGLVIMLFKLLALLLPKISVHLRAGIRNFLRRKREAMIQTIAFGLTIMAMLIVVFLRTELISAWESTIPENAPNHFVLNIQNNEAIAYQQFIDNKNYAADPLYPVVRGRLTRINDIPVNEIVSKEETRDNALRRELNLTWSETIPPDNKLTAGRWWQPDDAGNVLVSVESQLAERLSINIDDTLTFFTGDRQWQTQVVSIREVKWDNFSPNFYMVFNPGAIDHLPGTWINSFHLPAEKKKSLVNLLTQFPAITLLEMDSIINQVKSIITQVTLAIESILSFVLIAGLVVTLSAIQSSMNDRLREGALMRTFGASQSLLRTTQLSEFCCMGFVAGLIGVMGAEAVNAVLYIRIFELDYSPAWWAWLTIPILSAALIGLVGLISCRRSLNVPPMHSLRELRG